MGIITDDMVLDAVKHYGTCTATMIYDFIAENVIAPRDVISSRAGRKLRQFVIYGILDTVPFDGKTWYFLNGGDPHPFYIESPFVTDRVKTFASSLPYGEPTHISSFVDASRGTRAHVRKTLRNMDGVVKVGKDRYMKIESARISDT